MNKHQDESISLNNGQTNIPRNPEKLYDTIIRNKDLMYSKELKHQVSKLPGNIKKDIKTKYFTDDQLWKMIKDKNHPLWLNINKKNSYQLYEFTNQLVVNFFEHFKHELENHLKYWKINFEPIRKYLQAEILTVIDQGKDVYYEINKTKAENLIDKVIDDYNWKQVYVSNISWNGNKLPLCTYSLRLFISIKENELKVRFNQLFNSMALPEYKQNIIISEIIRKGSNFYNSLNDNIVRQMIENNKYSNKVPSFIDVIKTCIEL